MSEQISIKEKIREEFIKCAQDPVYFMRKYYTIQHPQRGRQLFDLYPFQEKVLRLFQKYPDSIINKSRQLGISTLVSAYSLWLMVFNKDKNILVIATKQDTAKNMVTKVRFAYDNLPVWLRIGTGATENNRLSLRLANGSQIKAVSAAGDSGRSEALSLLVFDEAAFIDYIDEIVEDEGPEFDGAGFSEDDRDEDGVNVRIHIVTNEEADEDAKQRSENSKGVSQFILDFVQANGLVSYTEMNDMYKAYTGGSNSFSHILKALMIPYKNRESRRYLVKHPYGGYHIRVATIDNWVVTLQRK